MSYLVDAVGEYLRGTLSSGQNPYPITMAIWVKHPDWDATQECAFSACEDFTGTSDQQYIQKNLGIDRVVATSSSAALGQTGATYTFGTPDEYNDIWVPVVAVYTAGDDRDIYIDVIGQTTNNTTDKTFTDLQDSITVGNNSNNTLPWRGLVSHPAIWTSALSTADVTSYLGSTSQADIEAISAGTQLGYWPLDSNSSTHVNEWGAGSADLTVTNATYSSDEPFAGAATTTDVNYRGRGRGIMRGIARKV